MQSMKSQSMLAVHSTLRGCSMHHNKLLASVRPRVLYRPRCTVSVRATQAATQLPPNLSKIVGAFQMVPDPMARYKQLLFFASKLPPLPKEQQVAANKVEGCVSQVWVVAELQDDGNVYWKADSDSQLTKGLAALLVQGLSGVPPAEVASLDPGFIEALGLKQALTPSRNNGFLNMFKLMQRKAAQLQAVQEVASSAPEPAAAPDSPSATPVRDAIVRKLTEALQPTRLEVVDDSAKHAGHAGSRMTAGGGGETHFVVTVVSDAFQDLNAVARHKKIYQLLDEELKGSVHALSLVTKTPQEEL